MTDANLVSRTALYHVSRFSYRRTWLIGVPVRGGLRALTEYSSTAYSVPFHAGPGPLAPGPAGSSSTQVDLVLAPDVGGSLYLVQWFGT